MRYTTAMTRCLTAEERARYAVDGWVAPNVALPPALLAPLRESQSGFAARPPRQELLCGIHNPFGFHVFEAESWAFLALAESVDIIDLVEAVLGPDLVLWDSELYFDAAALPHEEGRYWPADPLAGTVVYVGLDAGRIVLADVRRVPANRSALPHPTGACYVLRYMPATSRYNRNPRFAPNRRAVLERPLVNYVTRPIWLVRGDDRAGSDFATGFAPPAVRWAVIHTLPGANPADMSHVEAKGGTVCR